MRIEEIQSGVEEFLLVTLQWICSKFNCERMRRRVGGNHG